ncbi:Protein transport protein SEC24 [Mycena venus]|uniref:Protein transport protein SEC24 n=1 Tax=Mycena venus TaxID=2733690 RepID=A0A8H6YCI7_9AGAR|nr:Protein transport protein SEC24 [Mycena venus]
MSSPTHALPKKRQYAAGETQVYYGSPEGQYPVDTAHDLHQQSVNTGSLLAPQHVDLMTYPPDPRDLYAPLPEIQLPFNLTTAPESSDVSLYQSSTLNAVPKTENLLHDSKVPLGLVISPHRTLADGEEAVPLVEDGVIARCRRCRAYINPYVQFIDGSSRWRCSLCGLSNEVPQSFQWSGRPEQPYARVELSHPVVDFVAPAEYVVRGAPLAPAYVFLLDVSQGAIHSGMFHTALRTMAESLDRLPNDQLRTKVAIICYDISLYFFSMPPSGEFGMLVVSDLEEPYLPRCDDLPSQPLRVPAVPLAQRLKRPYCSSSAATGGKIVLLSASVPTLGKGALDGAGDAQRRNDSQKEPDSDKSASAFYHAFALSCIKSCVSVDVFLAGDQYRGVATLSELRHYFSPLKKVDPKPSLQPLLPHYASGQAFYYSGFNAAVHEDAVKFAVELGRVLTMPSMLEAEMRLLNYFAFLACFTLGISVKSMHGNFFVQGTDRVVMPAVPLDQSYAVELQIEETLAERMVVFQTGLLHTTSSGERRIRVLTLALPTTSVISEVFASADARALAVLLAKQAVQRTSVLTLEDRREQLLRKVAAMCAAYKAVHKTHSPELQLLLPANLKMFPILVLGLFKKIATQLNTERVSDVRAYTRVLLTSAAPQQLIRYIYPDIYSLHNMPADVGFVGSEGTLIMPTPLPLTSTWWESHGLYLIDDGQVIYLIVSRDAVPLLINDVFDVRDYQALKGGKFELPEVNTAISERIRSIVGKIRERDGAVHYPTVCVVKDDASSETPAMRSAAVQALIHDRVDDLRLSYRQFLVKIYGKVCEHAFYSTREANFGIGFGSENMYITGSIEFHFGVGLKFIRD